MFRPKTTLEQWRILQAVVDHGGYAQAAAALNKSQSSLNHAVAKMQAMLDVELLEVKGRKAFLTEAGEVMLRRSRDLTQTVESLEQLAININQDWEPEITLAIDLAYPRELLFPVLESFLPDSRGSRLRIIDTVLTGSLDAITEKQADLVIHVEIPKGFLGEPLTSIKFVLVCHPEHPLAIGAQPIPPQTLAQHTQIVIADTSSRPNEKQGWLKSENRWTVSQFDTAIDLLLRKFGFCWIPEHKVKSHIRDGSLKQITVEGSQFKLMTAFLICPQAQKKGPGVTLLESLILQHRDVELL